MNQFSWNFVLSCIIIFQLCLTVLIKIGQSSLWYVQELKTRIISGFGRRVNEIFALLRCYALLIFIQLPTFWDNTSVPSSRVKLDPWTGDQYVVPKRRRVNTGQRHVTSQKSEGLNAKHVRSLSRQNAYSVMKITAFSHMTPYWPVVCYRHVGSPCCLRLHGSPRSVGCSDYPLDGSRSFLREVGTNYRQNGVISQKIPLTFNAVVKTSKPQTAFSSRPGGISSKYRN
jgi:hypothetical protein